MGIDKNSLAFAYLQANYIVTAKNAEITFRIGEQNAVLDSLLERHNAKTFALITAYNPRSEPASDDENQRWQIRLTAELNRQKLKFLDGRGESVDGEWEAEPSAFIFDIERAEAIALAQQFEQNAIVYGTLNHAPELVWCQ